ncbi:MAG: MFS transporter [Methanomicrobiales archaeon]|nr:MFS transporter [Methanomicrobiales archaeon]
MLFILALGTLMGALDSTIVILAFPTISEQLHSDLITTLWIILIYLLIVAITTTQLGRLGDIYGRSRMFNSGFAIFTIGSLFCGFSHSIWVLILSRGIQAFGGSLMQANSGAIIADTFAIESRGTAYGYNSLGWTSGAMLGIVLGGIITTFVGWEYIFFINIPIGIVATILGILYIRDVKLIDSNLDIIGMMLLAAGLVFISYGAVDFVSVGTAMSSTLFFGTGIVFIVIFGYYELRTPTPVIDPGIFRDRVLRYSILAAFFQALGYISVVFLIIMYLQGIRGLSPLDASLLLIPGYVVGSFFSPVMGHLSDRYGSRLIAMTGTLVIMLATLLYLMLQIDTPLWVILIASGISGLGTAMFFPANNSAVMANARPGSYGSISGVLRTVQNVGILMSFVVAISVAAASIPREVAFEVFIGTTNLVGGVSEAFITGIHSALMVSLMILAIAATMSWIRGKGVRSPVKK